MKNIIVLFEKAQLARFRQNHFSFSLTLSLRRIFSDLKAFCSFKLAVQSYTSRGGFGYQNRLQANTIVLSIWQHAAAVILGFVVLLGPTNIALAQDSNPDKRELVKFVRDILFDHPALQVAQAELNAAEARGRAFSRPVYNPEIELEYEDAADKTKAIGINQSFDFSGKRGARREVADADVLSAHISANVVRTNLISELLNALVNYGSSQRAYQFENKRVRLAREFSDIARKLYESGDLNQNDLLTAKLSYASAEVSLSAATNSLSDAVAQLVAITGQERQDWPVLPSEFDIVPSVDLSILDQLPHLQLAKSRSQISRSRIKLAQRERLPDPTFGVRYGNEGPANLVGFQFSMPIPIRNTRSEEVKAATEEATATDLTYAELLRRARANLSHATKKYETLLRAWNVWEAEGVVALFQQTNLLERLLQVGELNAANYLVLLNQTFDAEAQAIKLYGDLWHSRILWLEASGNLIAWTGV